MLGSAQGGRVDRREDIHASAVCRDRALGRGFGDWGARSGQLQRLDHLRQRSEGPHPPGLHRHVRPLDSSLTQVLTGVRRANKFPAASPTDGVIVRFGIKSATAGLVTFRLARLSGEGATGAGTGPVVLLPGAGTFSFPADTPVRAGDYVGVDT